MEAAVAGDLQRSIFRLRKPLANPPRHKLLQRALRGVFLSIMLCAFGYVAAINAFLYFNGISLLFKSTNTVNATYQRAYSLWPGVVHATGLRVVFQDKNVQFSLEIAELKARIVLSELLRRRFHVKSVSGSGAVFRMRHRIDPESRDQSWVSALPPIPEFPSPAVFEPTVPEPEIPDSEYNLWTVHLENVAVGVAEVWVQFVRFAGPARAEGAFRLVPARTLWVGPASLALEGGHLYFGEQPISSRVSGRVSCKVDYFDVRIPQGRDVFRYINGRIALGAKDFVVDPFFQFLAKRSVHVSSKPAELATDIGVTRGHLNSGSNVSYATERLHVELAPLMIDTRETRVRGQMTTANTGLLDFSVDQGSIGPNSAIAFEQLAGNLTTIGSDLTGEFALKEKALRVGHLVVDDARKLNALSAGRVPITFQGGTLQGSVSVRDSDDERDADLELDRIALRLRHADWGFRFNGALGGSFHGRKARAQTNAWARLEHAEVQAAGTERALAAELSSLVASGSYLRSSTHRALKFEASVASLSGTAGSTRVLGRTLATEGELKGSRQRMNGGAKVALGSLQVRSRKSVLTIEPSAHIRLSDFDEDRLTGKIEAGLQFVGWNATYGDDAGQCSSLIVPKARLAATANLGHHQSAALQASLEGVRFKWGTDFSVSSDITVRSEWAGNTHEGWNQAEVSTRLLGASIVSGKGGTAGWQAKVPEVRIDAKGARTQRHFVGTLTLDAKDTTGRIGGAHVNATLGLAFPRFTLDLNTGSAVLDGQARVRDASLRAGDQRIDNWWATIDAQSAELLARENLDLVANFRASLRDATPGLILLAEDGQLPGWLSSALPLSEMRIQGQAARRCRLTTIRFDEATGGPLKARGTLQSTSDLVRGAFLVRLAPVEVLSAGVEVGPPDSGVSLFAGDKWLETRIDRLENAARQILASACESQPEPQLCAEDSVTVQQPSLAIRHP